MWKIKNLIIKKLLLTTDSTKIKTNSSVILILKL